MAITTRVDTDIWYLCVWYNRVDLGQHSCNMFTYAYDRIYFILPCPYTHTHACYTYMCNNKNKTCHDDLWHCNVFRLTGPLWGNPQVSDWFQTQNANNADLWCVLWCQRDQTVAQTIALPLIWDANALIWRRDNAVDFWYGFWRSIYMHISDYGGLISLLGK